MTRQQRRWHTRLKKINAMVEIIQKEALAAGFDQDTDPFMDALSYVNVQSGEAMNLLEAETVN